LKFQALNLEFWVEANIALQAETAKLKIQNGI